MSEWIEFRPKLKAAERRKFLEMAKCIAKGATSAAREAARTEKPALSASIHLLCDLSEHGWSARIRTPKSNPTVEIQRQSSYLQSDEQRDLVRKQHLRARNEQLHKASVTKFIRSMERRRNVNGAFVSIFSLMRDGRELASALRAIRGDAGGTDAAALQRTIQPYIQVVSTDAVCSQTGLSLNDIWRYFRHTWASHYASVPGRSMAFLVRDAAVPFHPVIGIGALGSAVVQNTVRDDWLGWTPSAVVEELRQRPTKSDAVWLSRILEEGIADVYIADLLRDGKVEPSDLKKPRPEVIEQLAKEASRAKGQHQDNYEPDDHRRGDLSAADDDFWIKRAETDLFRSKRADLLAMLLEVRRHMLAAFDGPPSSSGLARLLDSTEGRRMVGRLIHRKKAESVGVCIADVTVCGAIAPYSHLTGGKLVAMLACSPEIVCAYKERYKASPSIIASSLAGREVVRQPHLVALSTTSLYGVEPNQYTRLRIPASVVGGSSDESVRYEKLGITEGYGTFHLTSSTRKALWEVVQQDNTRTVVNWLFGEGVNPRLRGLRDGMDVLELPSDQILKHGSAKIVYGVRLARNAEQVLLGKQKRPRFYLPTANAANATRLIADHWTERWLTSRAIRDDVLERVESEQTVYPVTHGARVKLPIDPLDRERQLELFEPDDPMPHYE